MKKRFTIVLAILAAIVSFSAPIFARPSAPAPAVPIIAQEPSAPVEVEPTKVEAILAIFGGGLVTLVTQGLKKLFKATGFFSGIITGFVAVATTGVYFLVVDPLKPWNWLVFGIYAFVIFGEATTWWHLYRKAVPKEAASTS